MDNAGRQLGSANVTDNDRWVVEGVINVLIETALEGYVKDGGSRERCATGKLMLYSDVTPRKKARLADGCVGNAMV